MVSVVVVQLLIAGDGVVVVRELVDDGDGHVVGCSFVRLLYIVVVGGRHERVTILIS